jgi:hypothetical protein
MGGEKKRRKKKPLYNGTQRDTKNVCGSVQLLHCVYEVGNKLNNFCVFVGSIISVSLIRCSVNEIK